MIEIRRCYTRAVLYRSADATSVREACEAAAGAGANLTRASLRDANLTGANLTGANLTGAVLTGAVLTGAVLTGAVLTGAVLTGAVLTGVPIPSIPNIDAAILAAIDRPGCSLDMSKWHTCETTHCRAGWAIHLAGDAGRALEDRVGASAAGALIYAASGSHPAPNFYATDDAALADMRARAGR
jgi:uncharacterized protein YjbI with pentapeptide repeats